MSVWLLDCLSLEQLLLRFLLLWLLVTSGSDLMERTVLMMRTLSGVPHSAWSAPRVDPPGGASEYGERG